MRKFIDLLNESNLFTEKLEYPVLHPAKLIEYADEKNIWFYPKEKFDSLYGHMSSEEREKMMSSIQERFEEEKKSFPKRQDSYVDYRVEISFKDDLKEVINEDKLENYKSGFYEYLCQKLNVYKKEVTCEIRQSENNLFYMDTSEDTIGVTIGRWFSHVEYEELSLGLSVVDRTNDHCENRWNFFLLVLVLKTDEETRKNVCDLRMDKDSCMMVIYF